MRMWLRVVLVSSVLWLHGCESRQEYVASSGPPVEAALPSSGLPLPSTMTNAEFQSRLYPFLDSRRYVELGWAKDKRIRDTGPFRNGESFGTHPAVRMFYSPEVLAWLTSGRQGDLPDGAMIVKEMFTPPAARYQGRETETVPSLWTVMVRDRAGSHDGWYWAFYDSNPDATDPATPQKPDSDSFPFSYPNSGFGSYCVRCHGSAESLLTFSSTKNIEGFPGQPTVYDVDDSWMRPTAVVEPPAHPNRENHPELTANVLEALEDGRIDQQFLDYFDQFPAQSRDQIAHLPPVTTDRVVAKAHRQFTTSDQCMSCHVGDTSAFGPNMIKDGVDVSPWGEWSMGMMGLAGRDPIFYAQMETEFALHDVPGGDFNAATIANFCLRCHGVMGQRQYTSDHPGQPFALEKALARDERHPDHIYGGLARDGVSCTVCHQIADQSRLPLEQIETGKFVLEPALDGVMQIFGPYQQPTTRPMLASLGMKARHGQHLTDSLLCASCHTVDLPVLDQAGKTVDTRYEQVTFFEWQNSAFGKAGTDFQSCQDCHMPKTFHGDPLEFKLANVQDQDFPPGYGVAPVNQITVPVRDGFARHELAGINVFGLEFFRQYPNILGIRPKSFMTGFENGLDNSINNSLTKASQSARVEVLRSELVDGRIEAAVKVTNLVGHRLPSGVGFRRLLLEVVVKDAGGNVVWGSGRTNRLGLVIDAAGNPLPSETHALDPLTGLPAYEPHHQVVDSQSEAQIYGELNKNTMGEFTTSFLARAQDVKDNRLMPRGWSFDGVQGMTHRAVEATNPVGEAASDPDFVDGTGSDTVTYRASLPVGASGPFRVEAKLFYQAIPPGYLKQRFDQASGPATRRLHYMASRLKLDQTSFPDWKLPLASDGRDVE